MSLLVRLAGAPGRPSEGALQPALPQGETRDTIRQEAATERFLRVEP
jgi:hypothetical protein